MEQTYEAVSKDEYSGGAYIIRNIIYRLRSKLKITNIRTLQGYVDCVQTLYHMGLLKENDVLPCLIL